ncbi:NAD-dependent epimerase/dehydratase family protein [Novosphingobium humi]|uniref:NAD-dependent epimerase/dehydratase family protein n=1 Tax=Novosphingobium humi TaxID=2282397 RepID=UPI00338EAFC1
MHKRAEVWPSESGGNRSRRFVGRALLPLLAPEHEVVAIDTRLSGRAGIEGDLRDPLVLQKAFGDGCDALIHLSTIPGGRAEQDPDLAWRVNVDATMSLIHAAAEAGRCRRIIFASSIAVLGAAATCRKRR